MSSETWLPCWTRRQFYRHGLLCASYSRSVLLLTAVVVCLVLRPLLSIPVYLDEVREEHQSNCPGAKAHVLQILVQAVVHPYPLGKTIVSDAFRAPIASAFKLHLQDILPYRDAITNVSLDESCVRTDGLSSLAGPSEESLLSPAFGCLLLSPANLWGRDQSRFEADADVVETVMSLHERRGEGTSSLMEMLFGLRQRETGVNRLSGNRQRVIRYALTLALKEHDASFVSNFKRHLLKLYPLSDQNQDNDSKDQIVHLFFPSTSHLYDVLVFCVTVSSLFLYMWITCKKIELVRSPLAIGLGAVVTSVTAILMAVSLSGLSINLDKGKMIFMPYILTFISLENVLVITRSIVQTPAHLDARIRVAQGLSKEGWNITKNLLLEISLLAFGFASLYYAGVMDTSIKDFCTLSVLGLLSDFFLQTFLFTTILACDMSNIELADDFGTKNDSRSRKRRIFRRPQLGPGLRRTSSISNETSVMAPQCEYSKNNGIEDCNEPRRVRLMNFFASKRISQRLFVVTIIVWFAIFCYQTRFFEEALLYEDSSHKNGHKNDNVNLNKDPNSKDESGNVNTEKPKGGNLSGNKGMTSKVATIVPRESREIRENNKNTKIARDSKKHVNKSPANVLSDNKSKIGGGVKVNLSDIFIDEPLLRNAVVTNPSTNPTMVLGTSTRMRHSWRRLPLSHWHRLFELYNLSLKRHCLAILNPIELAIVIEPDGALRLRHPKDIIATDSATLEESFATHNEKMLTEEALFAFSEVVHEIGTIRWIPSTVGEVFLALAFVVPTLLFLSYVLTVLYAIITCRHYAEWRAAREQQKSGISKGNLPPPDPRTQIVQESLPISLPGHNFDIENIVVDPLSHIFVSHCLAGVINAWDAVTAEKISTVSRDPTSSVWTLDCCDLLLATGCSDGSVEVFDTRTGLPKDVWQSSSSGAVSQVRFVSPQRLAVARIGGFLELFAIDERQGESSKKLRLRLLHRLRAHPSDIQCLVVGLNCIVTGSVDQTLRVFRMHWNKQFLEPIYTLHGHRGEVTTAFVDDTTLADDCISSAGSGSSDGMVCVWDVFTGACVYSLLAHEGGVLNLTHSPSYVISLGEDRRICVWERKEGYLINTIALDEYGVSARELVMLSHNLVVSSGLNGLIVWDARLMDPVKEVKLVAPPLNQALGRSVKMIGQLGDTIAASIGNHLRLIHFPLLSDKSD